MIWSNVWRGEFCMLIVLAFMLCWPVYKKAKVRATFAVGAGRSGACTSFAICHIHILHIPMSCMRSCLAKIVTMSKVTWKKGLQHVEKGHTLSNGIFQWKILHASKICLHHREKDRCVHHTLRHWMRSIPFLWHHYYWRWLVWLCYLFSSWPTLRVAPSTQGMNALIQAMVLSGLGVKLLDPIPLGRNTTLEGKHVHWSEFKMFVATNSRLL